jgi:hypothetical protein
MRDMLRTFASIILAALLAGCGGKSQSYQVIVHNASPKSLTVWLTKNGPPDEPGWRAPEDVALETLGAKEPLGGVIIPPGKTGETKPVRGTFPEGTDAVLRVYVGQLAFDDLLAVSKGSPNRIDVVLNPGTNELTVRDRRGAIVVEGGDGAGVDQSQGP